MGIFSNEPRIFCAKFKTEKKNIRIYLQCAMNNDCQIRASLFAGTDHGEVNVLTQFHLPFVATIYTLNSSLCHSNVQLHPIFHTN